MTTHPLTTIWQQFIKMAMCLTSVAAVQFASMAHAKDTAESYLQDGKLKERIEIHELQGGVAGFNGTYYSIESDGTWSTGDVIQQTQKKPKANGKLTGEQLAQLAKVMAEHDLATLPSFGEPVTNPQMTEVHFGKKVSTRHTPIEAAPKEEDKLIHARYNGIAQAVKQLCIVAKKK